MHQGRPSFLCVGTVGDLRTRHYEIIISASLGEGESQARQSGLADGGGASTRDIPNTWPQRRSSQPRRRRSSGPLRSAPSARARPSCRACFYSRSTSEPLVMARRCQRAFRSACAPPASHCSCPVSTALCNTSSIRDGLRNAGTRYVSSAPAAVQPPILPRQLRQAPDMPSPHSHHHQLLHPHNHHHPQKSLQSEPHKQPRRRRPKEPHARARGYTIYISAAR